MPQDPFNVVIARHVKEDQVQAYEKALHDWVPKSLEFPGHLGVLLVTPREGDDQYGAVLRFKDRATWEKFSAWPPYVDFKATIRTFLKEAPSERQLEGLEAWFNPDEKGKLPPKWKMAILTWVGVCISVFVFQKILIKGFRENVTLMGQHAALEETFFFFLGNALVVSALTWLVMPFLTSFFSSWIKKK